jgi:hypothetical protein
MFHLGNDRSKDWPEAPVEPTPPPLEIRFESPANASEWVLEVAARDVDDRWALELNGRIVAELRRIDAELVVSRYALEPNSVRAGTNVLTVRPLGSPDDDLTVGRVRLCSQSLREVERLGRLDVSVVDQGGAAIPARLTLASRAGGAPEIHYAARDSTAVRPGIAYAADGRVALEIAEGEYEVWASRGMEWSVARAGVRVEYGTARELRLELEREVDTTGWIAADTHVHTLTYSGHGDASVEERLVTLAGEGIELAIATDHNHHTDYRPRQLELGMQPWFTSVVGNEVTTENGHMNAFPMDPAGPVPDYEIGDWKRLVAGIRARGARVVILNHPRWPEDGKDPLTVIGFDEQSGANAAGQAFDFDAVELVNSDAPTSPPRAVLPAWFALLESGSRMCAVGASDSHAVGVIVGQGRTYVPSASVDPARIDVDAACQAFLQGRVSVSLGMFATIEIQGRGMGETVRVSGDSVDVAVDVRHPRWVRPRALELYVNRERAAVVRLDDGLQGDQPTRKQRRTKLALPRASNWVVAVAVGDPVEKPFWKMKLPETMAVTNPIWLLRQ